MRANSFHKWHDRLLSRVSNGQPGPSKSLCPSNAHDFVGRIKLAFIWTYGSFDLSLSWYELCRSSGGWILLILPYFSSESSVNGDTELFQNGFYHVKPNSMTIQTSISFCPRSSKNRIHRVTGPRIKLWKYRIRIWYPCELSWWKSSTSARNMQNKG